MVVHNQGKQAFKRIRRRLNLEVNREPLPAYDWLGGYPIRYLCKDGEYICPKCVNDNIGLIDLAMKNYDDKEWEIVGMDINYKDENCTCGNCQKDIPLVYYDNGEMF